MSRKGSKGKPTRKDMENGLLNLNQAVAYIGLKLKYLEDYAKSTEKALDLFIRYLKHEENFMKYIEKYQKELENKKVEKEAKKS